MKDSFKTLLKVGLVVRLKRKPTNENHVTEVFRTIKEIDLIKRTILCDDNIIYKFNSLLYYESK